MSGVTVKLNLPMGDFFFQPAVVEKEESNWKFEMFHHNPLTFIFTGCPWGNLNDYKVFVI